MKSIVSFFIGLIFGAAGGAYIAKSIADKKAEDAIEKATLEARDYYKQKFEKKEEPKPESKVEDMTRIYGKAFDIPEERPAPESDAETYAYEIEQDEYGEDPGYTTYSLDYYADGNLVDETDNIVDDPVHMVGGDVLDKLDVDNPVAYVRNDITKTDYEVCYVDYDFKQGGGLED